MKSFLDPYLGRFVVGLLLLVGWCTVASAQTTQPPGTRVTACDPATPNNAICITWPAPATNADGSPTVLPLVYRIEQQMGTGAWTQIATGLTTTKLYVKNLNIGTYTFRVYVNCSPNCIESGPAISNSKDATAPVVQPNPPPSVLVTQVTVTISAPAYRIIGRYPNASRGDFVGLVPVGRDCTGPVLFSYKRISFRAVIMRPSDWIDGNVPAVVAAPCTRLGG